MLINRVPDYVSVVTEFGPRGVVCCRMILDFLIFALSNLVCEDAASIFGRVGQLVDLIDNYIDLTSRGSAGAGVRGGGTCQSIHRCRTGEVRWSCASRMI